MDRRILPKTVVQKVQNFAKCATLSGIPISEVYVFGSYAKGTNRKWSDIDVCIISPRFTNSFDALQELWSVRGGDFIPIEPIGMTPEDLSDRYSSLATEIRKYGIKISLFADKK